MMSLWNQNWAHPRNWKKKKQNKTKQKIFAWKSRNHAIFKVFWLNMQENDNNNLHTMFWLYITTNIFKTTKFYFTWLHQPLLWRLTLPPEYVVCSIFLRKIKRKDELIEIPSNFIPLLHVFEHMGKTGLGIVATSLQRTRVKKPPFLFFTHSF